MPKTESHLTIGQLNSSLGRAGGLGLNKGGIRPFRHTTTFGVHPGPVQVAPDEPRGPEDRAKRNRAIYGDEDDKGVPVSGSFGTDTMIGGAGNDTMTIPGVSRMESYIRDAAVKRGINPDVAVKVAKSEGLKRGTWQSNVVKSGVREDSFGPFQLKETNGLGAVFEKQTGLDVRDKKNVFAQIDFALDYAAQHGWGSWYGAAKVGVSKWTGLKNAQPIGITAQAPAADLPQNQSNPFEAQPSAGPAGYAYSGLLGTPTGAEMLGSSASPQLAGANAQDTLSQWAAGQDFGAKQKAAQQSYAARSPVANTEADIQRMEREQGMYQPSRFGGLLDQSAGAAGFEGGAPFAGFDAQRGLANFGRFAQPKGLLSTPDDGLGRFATAGTTQGAFQGTPTINKMVDGMMNPAGNVDTAVAPDPAAEQAAMAALQGPDAARMAFAPEQQQSPAVAALDSRFGQPATPDPARFGQPAFAPTPHPAPNIASTIPAENAWGLEHALAQDTVPEQDQTIAADFPAQPEEPSIFDAAMASPTAKRIKDAIGLLNPMSVAQGLLSGDPMGKLGGLLDGLNGGPAGRSPANIDAGFGMQAMEQGMYGPRGTFGRSLSNPGAFSTSRGPGQGWDLHNQFGAVTPYSADGHVTANAGTMKAWGGLLDGLFGGGLLGSRPDKDRDKDKSRGGPVGGYSGNGLY